MKTVILILALLMVFVSTASAHEYVYRGESYCERVSYKLGRGISNIVHGHTDIWHYTEDAYIDYGFAGAQIGVIQGACKMLGRLVLGIGDVITFPITYGVENFPMTPEIPSYY